jgi:hypothetical protein
VYYRWDVQVIASGVFVLFSFLLGGNTVARSIDVRSIRRLSAGRRLGRGILILAGAMFWAVGDRARALEPPEMTPEEQAAINKAIDKGVQFLRKTQNRWGTWGKEPSPAKLHVHSVSYTALAGLTLLECGVPAKDPAVQAAAQVVREHLLKSDRTYELSLCILFLDRLGDKRDVPAIQGLAMRLIAGQTTSGGWSYQCPILTPSDQTVLWGLLKQLSAPKPPPGAKAPPAPRIPPNFTKYPALQDLNKLIIGDDPADNVDGVRTDNSNSQFAILALWVAQRHGVPVERTLNLVVQRYLTSQEKNGRWGYHYKRGGGVGGSPAMTCVGLLGLAIGFALGINPPDDGAAEPEPPPPPPMEMVASRRVTRLGCIKFSDVVDPEPPKVQAAVQKHPKQNRMVRGFTALSGMIGRPSGRMENLPMQNLYFLWSVERVGELYGVRMIGDKDWYRWGAEILVANQNPHGGWEKGGDYHGADVHVNTCLALLFLKRANLVSDLTTRLPFEPTDLTREIQEKSQPVAVTKAPPVHNPPVYSDVPPPPIDPPQYVPPPTPEPPPPPPPQQTTPEPVEEPKPNRGPHSGILGILFLLFVGGLGYFLMGLFGSRDSDRPKKKKKKKKKVEPEDDA